MRLILRIHLSINDSVLIKKAWEFSLKKKNCQLKYIMPVLVPWNVARWLHLNCSYIQFKITYRFFFFYVFFMMQGAYFVHKTLFKRLTSYITLEVQRVGKIEFESWFRFYYYFLKQKGFLQKGLSKISRICFILCTSKC